jgi:hypothetical protein
MGLPSLLAAFFKHYRRYVLLFYLFILGVIVFHSLTALVAVRYYLIFWPLMIILSVIFFASLFQKVIPNMKKRQMVMITFAVLLGAQMFSCDLIRIVEGANGPERIFANNDKFQGYEWAKTNVPKDALVLANDFKRWHYHLGHKTISANQVSFRNCGQLRNTQNLMDVLGQFRPQYAEDLPTDEKRMLVEPKTKGWIIHADRLDMQNYLKDKGFDKFPEAQRRLLTNGTVHINVIWSKNPIPDNRPMNAGDLVNNHVIYQLEYPNSR